MDPEDETGSAGQGQNLHDLQNYLSTFNKEIEPGDDVLSSMDVDGAVGDVGDLYSSSSGNPLQEPGEGTVTSQFSSGFYSEQGILDTPLSDESAQQIQNLVTETDREPDIKQEVGSIDLETVQAQIASFGGAHGIGDIHSSSLPQSLVMTSLGDNLDHSAGKVIRIVSLGDEGQFLSLTDGSQMQILNQDLGMSADTLNTSVGAMGNEAGTINTSSPHATSMLGAAGVVMAGRGGIMTLAADTGSSISGRTQLVALQDTSGSGQSQLVAFSQGAGLNTESLQVSGLLAADGTISSELGYQTITILPSELSQNGDMNYVLIMAPPDSHKDGGQPLAQVIEDLKQENQELSEELVEINGEMKRVLRVIPKKLITANFGAQLMCSYCDYTSPKRYLLTRHMKSHSDERPHKCKECERGFKTPASLLNHINTHTGTRPHKCKTCEAAFTTSGELVRHIRYRHTFEKPHRCPNCDYASVELSKLKRHMRSHTGERPYKCLHCPYASPDTYKLKRHLRIHTGEKPYECDICHARFTQSNSLKAHKLIHSGNKPVFQCDLCPTTCGRKTDLKIHFNKLHSMGSPLECKKCGQVFSDRYSYKQHMRSHDVDKCLKCDFVASNDQTLDLHAAIHSNRRKFECDACHSSFNLKQTLDKHRHSCHLGAESGVDSQSSCSRDKENKDDAVFSLEGSTSTSATTSQLVCGPLASDTLHKNLLQDIKAGKLGDVPQVVIVHPDGSLEEISSKGDKLNLEDIFAALSSSGRIEGVGKARERGQTKGSHGGGCSTGTESRKQTNGKQDLSDDDEDEDDDDDEEEEEEEQENGETSQCEASTQVELESDTDSVDDDSHIEGSHTQFHQVPEKEMPHLTRCVLSESMGDQSTSSDMETTAVNNTEAASEALSSLLHSMATSSTATSSESLSSLLHSMATSSATTSSEQAAASGQQFVMVKGYTCLNNDTSQPTLVSVAVDKDSLMKMFASLATSGESGMHLLTGDMESPIALSIENSQATSLPLNQLHLHHFGIISGLPGSLIVAANFEQNEDPSTSQDQELTRDELISSNTSQELTRDELISSNTSQELTRDELISSNTAQELTRDELISSSTAQGQELTRDELISSSTANELTRNELISSSTANELTRNELISSSHKDLSSPSSKTSTSVITCADSHLKSTNDLPCSRGPTCLEMNIFDESSESTHVNTQTGNASPTIKTSQSNEQLLATESQTRAESDKLLKAGLSDEKSQPDFTCGRAVNVRLTDEHVESKQFHRVTSLLDNVCAGSHEILQITPQLPVNLLADKCAVNLLADKCAVNLLADKCAVNLLVDKCAASIADTSSSQASAVGQGTHPQESQSITSFDTAEDIPAVTFSTLVTEDFLPSPDKQKRSSRKRAAAADVDASLMMTGKRVRKTLVKVSM